MQLVILGAQSELVLQLLHVEILLEVGREECR